MSSNSTTINEQTTPNAINAATNTNTPTSSDEAEGPEMLKFLPKGAIPHVLGKGHSTLDRFATETGTLMGLLNFADQKALRDEIGLEINWDDGQVLSIRPDPEATVDSNMELACKKVASTIKRWREGPPPTNGNRAQRSHRNGGRGNTRQRDSNRSSSSHSPDGKTES